MPNLFPRRRDILFGGLALAVTAPLIAQSRPALHVAKDPGCGCCNSWARIVYDSGFDVTYEHRSNAALERFKLARSIPPAMFSCHTAEVEGYMIEGHVPPADIWRLITLRPGAIGLAVPGMPYGSPGMGPESERDAYSVMLMLRDGSAEVFAHYPAA